MATEKVSVLVPPLRPVPRGAIWVGRALDGWLAALARRRDAAQAARRVAADRAALVALARRFESSQPEFAKDLHAAAGADRDR